jgi:hypothetical protein
MISATGINQLNTGNDDDDDDDDMLILILFLGDGSVDVGCTDGNLPPHLTLCTKPTLPHKKLFI